MQACADLILDLGLYWVKFLDKDFIGRRQLRMQQS
jgi:glycine cleavage system aminomethyltransferase T